VTIRLALVGFGRWGRNYVTAADDSGAAIVSRVITRTGRDLTMYPLYRDTCLSESLALVDAVVYAGHPSGAVEACELALAAGKPVMVEKPAGLSVAEAQRIASAEVASKAFVLVAHQHLFAEGFEELRAMGQPSVSQALWGGPKVHDFSHVWDYGPHAAAVTIAIGARVPMWMVTEGTKAATVTANFDDGTIVTYDAYESQAEPPLTRAVRAFAAAVEAGGTDDYRFGSRWAVNVARILEASEAPFPQ